MYPLYRGPVILAPPTPTLGLQSCNVPLKINLLVGGADIIEKKKKK